MTPTAIRGEHLRPAEAATGVVVVRGEQARGRAVGRVWRDEDELAAAVDAFGRARLDHRDVNEFVSVGRIEFGDGE